jgi:preprotein translocase subunit SecG
MLLNLLLVLEIIVSLALVGVVLLQRSEGGGLVGGSTPSSFMTARGAGDLLTRTTWILGILFFVLGLLLTVAAGRERGGSSVVDRLKVDAIDPNTLNDLRPAQPAPGQSPAQPSPFQAPAPTVQNPFTGTEPAAPAPAAPIQP